MTANRHMKNREYQVIGNSDYISMMHHHGKVGKSRYDSVAESMKKSGFELVLVFDFTMTVLTGGLWLIWVAVKYLRTH